MTNAMSVIRVNVTTDASVSAVALS